MIKMSGNRSMLSYKLFKDFIKFCERHSINNPEFIYFMPMPFGFNNVVIFQNNTELHCAWSFRRFFQLIKIYSICSTTILFP